MNKVILLLVLSLAISIGSYAQKPKKIFASLQENNLPLALEEYSKIKSEKEYDNEDKVLLKLANCMFQIDSNYQKYNPIQAIKDFNGTYIMNLENMMKVLTNLLISLNLLI
jgi:hypothetical protein